MAKITIMNENITWSKSILYIRQT